MAILQTTSLLTDFGLLVLIWTVQAVIYPGFRSQASETFQAWHRDYTRGVAFIVAPLMLAQLATACLQLLAGSIHLLEALHIALVAATWIVTFLIFVPLHNTLQAKGKCEATITRLISNNWIRTGLWTLIFGFNLANRSTS